MRDQKAVVIGAGPAGLTTAYELLERTDIRPAVFEAEDRIGGLSCTVEHNGNRIDLGGHRFFSKSERVMDWWKSVFPIQGSPSMDDRLLGRMVPFLENGGPDPDKTDRVMLVRNRFSRIRFKKTLYEYPISLHPRTFLKLGLLRTLKIGLSYVRIRIFDIKDPRNLEELFIHRFGRELYRIFFKDYTEKVWGIPCRQISAEWGRQRIKNLSVAKTVLEALKKTFRRNRTAQSETETSLVRQFFYPKLGPGSLWETVADRIKENGGMLHRTHDVRGLILHEGSISGARIVDRKTGREWVETGDWFFSSMPVDTLILTMEGDVPAEVRRIASGLLFRDFIMVGILLKRLRIKNSTSIPTLNKIPPDQWIYIQERGSRIGRLQIFNNWSPYLVKNIDTVWIGAEYFCRRGDNLWSLSDLDMIRLATDELGKMKMISADDVLDGLVVRVPKAYPAYFGSYTEFGRIREFTDRIKNLFLIGRNGMHRYNNMDHSMLTAMTAVDNIVRNVTTKDNLWTINTDKVPYDKK